MILQTPIPMDRKPDVQLNLDYVLSMFEIIQTRKKSDRSFNDHVGTKALKQAEEFKALRALHNHVYFKPSTTKNWFNSMFDLIEKFYEEQQVRVTFARGL